MIQLDSGSNIGVDIYNQLQAVTFSSLPANPAEHNIYIRVEFASGGTDRTRNVHFQVTSSADDQRFADFETEVNTRAATEPEHIIIGPLIVDVSDGLRITAQSDNASDTSETLFYAVYSDDPEYYLTWRAAETSPTADSLTERIKTTDDNVTTLIGRITSTLFSGITSLAEWLGAMAGSHTADTDAINEINATGPGTGTGTYDEAADSQEAIANGAAGGGATAQQVWEYGTRVLTAGTNIGTVVANVTQIDGLATNDNLATLKLKQIDVTNDAADAVIIRSTSAFGNALDISSTGAGPAVKIAAEGTSTVQIAGTGTSGTILVTSTANGVAAIGITGQDGPGVVVSGTTFGIDIDASAGPAISAVSSGGNGVGIVATGNGSGQGVLITAGATGVGLGIVGGSSAGTGVRITTTVGAGIEIEPTSGIGLDITSNDGPAIRVSSVGGPGIQANGTTFGFEINASAAGSSGVRIVGVTNDILADITGNLSGSVGSMAADGISAASLAADASLEIAKGVLTLDVTTSVGGSASEDAIKSAGKYHNLTTIILAMLESSHNGTTWTIRQTDATTLTTKTITTDEDADPMTGVT